MPLSNPLDCTYCSEGDIAINICNYDYPRADPELQAYFVRNKCHHQMPAAVLYMPLIIIVIAAFLVFLDKPFVSKLFKSFNIDETFKAVVKDLELLTPQNRREKVHLTNYLDALFSIIYKFQEVCLKSILLGSVNGFHSSYIYRTCGSVMAALISLFVMSHSLLW